MKQQKNIRLAQKPATKYQAFDDGGRPQGIGGDVQARVLLGNAHCNLRKGPGHVSAVSSSQAQSSGEQFDCLSLVAAANEVRP
jgi:hypothetical protein